MRNHSECKILKMSVSNKRVGKPLFKRLLKILLQELDVYHQ